MTAEQSFAHDPRAIVKSIYDEAKLFWSLAMLAKLGAAIMGVAFVLVGTKSTSAPWALAAVAVLSEAAQWRSDVLKGRAEQLKRKIEFYDGLGWPMSAADLSDYLAKVSSRRRKSIEQSVRENYFASGKDKGIERALENLQESAWWSKHLASTMGAAVGVGVGVLIAASVLSLAVAIASAKEVAGLQALSRVVCAVLSLIVSLGAVKLLSGYLGFARRSEQVEEATKVLMGKTGGASETDAVKLTHDYQIARAASPMIPDLLWKLRRDALNALWDQYRRGA